MRPFFDKLHASISSDAGFQPQKTTPGSNESSFHALQRGNIKRLRSLYCRGAVMRSKQGIQKANCWERHFCDHDTQHNQPTMTAPGPYRLVWSVYPADRVERWLYRKPETSPIDGCNWCRGCKRISYSIPSMMMMHQFCIIIIDGCSYLTERQCYSEYKLKPSYRIVVQYIFDQFVSFYLY